MGLKYLNDSVTLKLNKEKCIGCRLCEAVCPHRVLKVNDKKSAIIERNKCIECGACASNCPAKAISVDSGTGCAIAVVHEMLKKNS
jgi:ferredoxin